MEGEYRRGRDLVGPIFLVSAGVVFLLNNLGVIDWGVWNVFLQLWPILLIAGGISMVFRPARRRRIGRIGE